MSYNGATSISRGNQPDAASVLSVGNAPRNPELESFPSSPSRGTRHGLTVYQPVSQLEESLNDLDPVSRGTLLNILGALKQVDAVGPNDKERIGRVPGNL